MTNKCISSVLFACVLTSIIIGCTRNITEPDNYDNVNDTLQYWQEPLMDATILYFRLFDTIFLDSTKAGEIQFRLEIAKSINDTLSICSVTKDWELGKLLVFVSESLYAGFDTSTFKFNYHPLDSLFEAYHLQSAVKKTGLLRFIFPKELNIPLFADIVNKNDGVKAAEPNMYAFAGLRRYYVNLEIVENIYEFKFYHTGSIAPNNWEIHVIDDKVELISRW